MRTDYVMSPKTLTDEVREIVFARDNHTCVVCGAPATNVHHRLLRSRAPKDPLLHNPCNLISVCGSGTTGCHGRIHANPQWAHKHGYMVHSWDEPERVKCEILEEDGKTHGTYLNLFGEKTYIRP